MNADLLAMLGGAGVPGSNASSRHNEGKNILTFKAGKMTTVLQPNGKYLVTADPRRGQINLLYHPPIRPSTTPTVKFEWRDRRTRTVVDDLTILGDSDDSISFRKIPTGREGDRVYLLQYENNADRRFFYWMQDKFVEGGDEKIAEDMNKFLNDKSAAAVAAGEEEPENPSAAAPTRRGATADSSTTATTTATTASAAATNQTTSSTAAAAETTQVDALSNILENLGMPRPTPPTSETTTTTNATATPSNTSRGGGTLTLADLQGAMAGLATSSPNVAPPPPPLAELLSPSLVEQSGILNNSDAVKRLMEHLPENQRSESFLKENLRSPQVLESLKSLMGVLMGGPDGVGSVIANFGLGDGGGEDEAGRTARLMAGVHPLKEFLDAVVKSVEKEKKDEEEKGGGEGKEEEKQG